MMETTLMSALETGAQTLPLRAQLARAAALA